MSFNQEANRVLSQQYDWMKGYLANDQKVSLMSETYFAGGLFTSLVNKDRVKDYDLFCSTTETAQLLFRVFKYSCNYANSLELEFEVDEKNPRLHRGKLVSTNPKLTVEQLLKFINDDAKVRKGDLAFLSKNALSLKNGIQVIFRFVGPPEEVFTTFDYEHCKVAWEPHPLGLTLGSTKFYGRSLESLAKAELMYSGNTRFVLSALSRLNKFIRRGWGIAPSSLLALALTASKIDWNNKVALEEELLGIYGIDPQVLTEILNLSQVGEQLDLDKVIEMLGEV